MSLLAVCTCGDATHTQQRLLACTHCGELRCPRCVQDEIVSYYCPNCLQDVPSATIKLGRNKCMNQCFRCPVCACIASVVTAGDEKAHYLACPVCRWTSQASGLVQATTVFSDAVRKLEVPTEAQTVFEHLQGKLIEMTRLATEQAPIGTAKKAARAAPVSSVRRSKLTASQIKKLGVTPSEGDNTDSAETSMVQEPAALVVSPPTVPEPEVDAVSLALLEASVDGLFERFDDFLNATTPTKDLATSKQRLRWTGGQAPLQKDLIPERVSLMTKKSRRCRVCTYNLIKPEAKAQVVKFSIHLCAVFFVPNVTISKISTKESESTVQLRAINPLEMDVLIKVTSAESKAKLPLQEILIGAYNEMGEYDDDDSEEAAKQLVPGVLEKKANHAIFEISVPSKASTRLSFAITYKGKPLSDQKLVGSMDLILVL